ncbi:hypothetical protein SAMN05443270_4611 [Lacrimispora sphenoides]|jgi:hypothetical protein|uniref:hypothetical protein n=1 Tax=Lacrimispora sphenoides TaxID=29370 RepID=UPI0008CFD001|nr:hypothetical protein [Lacrimispora sphenoides]SEU28759.1 hypothetical protein SAMN05443270_4611 [Lacrimispora sphenoides]
MASILTYNNCKKLYTTKKTKDELTPDFVEMQLGVVDVFLMAGRITEEQYTELMAILN